MSDTLDALESRVTRLESILRLLHPEVFEDGTEQAGRPTGKGTPLVALRLVSGDGAQPAPRCECGRMLMADGRCPQCWAK
jgi:hypothetical protein